jgi:DNA-binding CsgD family transcriptional regulator/PAS domain-containing protein
MSALSPDRSTIDLVGQIYDAVLDHEQWPRLVRELADTFNSKSALLRLMDRQCEYVSFTVAYGYDERFFGPYREHYIHIDPFNAYLMDRPLGTMVCTPEIMPMNQFTRTEYYNDYARPQDIYYAGGGFVLRDETSTAVLGFQRNKAMGAYGPEELQRIALFGTHLRRAFRLSRHFGQLHHQAQAVEQLLEQCPFGVILVNELGKAGFLNRRAETLVRIEPQLDLREGRITLRGRKAAQLDRLIHDAIDTALGKGTSAGGAIRLATTTDDAEPVVVVITPLRIDPRSTVLSGPRYCAAVFLGSPNERKSIAQQILHSLYTLTPAEARLAVELANGHDLDEISREFAITKHTARTQLKSIFNKTGCRRQAELVKVLLNLPLTGP